MTLLSRPYRPSCRILGAHILVASTLLGGCGGDHEPQFDTSITGGEASSSTDATTATPTTASTSAPDTTDTTTPTSTVDTTDPTVTPPTTSPDDTTVATTDALTSGATETTTTPPLPSCGDGQLDDGEDCDDGNDDETDACTSACKAPACDDGQQNGDETAVDCGGSCGSCTPCPSWTRQFGSASSDFGRGVAIDAEDSVVVSGSGGSDGFVKKFSVDGDELWSDVIDSGALDLITRVAIDGAGNALVTGLTKGSLDGHPKIGNNDAILIKYSPAGARLWTRQYGTTQDDRGMGVAIDGADNVFVVGSTYGNLDGNMAAGSEDLYIMKFDPQGATLWTRQLGTSTYDSAWDVATGPDDSVVLVGASEGDFDGHAKLGMQDAIVVKYDKNGAKKWSRLLGTDSFDIATAVAVDGDGAIVITGIVDGSLDGNVWAGQSDAFVRKYDAAGTTLWSRQLGTPLSESGRGVALDDAGDIYIGGQTETDLDGNMSQGDRDIYLAKYDAAGAKQWTQQFGSSLNDDGGVLVLTSGGDFIVVGDTLGGLDGEQQGGGDILAALRCAP